MRIVQLRPTRGSESTGDPVLRARRLEWEEGRGNFQLVHETDRSLRLSVDAEGRVSVAPQRLGKSQTFEMRYLRDGVNVVAVPETNFALCVDERGALCCDTISKDMHNYLELATVGEVPNGDVRKRQPTVRQSDMTEEEFRAQLAKPLWYDLRSDLREERKTFREEGKLLVESPQRRQPHATGRDSSPPTSPRSREGPPPRPPVFVGLARLFRELGLAGVAPDDVAGLRVLHGAAEGKAGQSISWIASDDLQRRIRERQREFDERMEARTEGARRLREELTAAVSPKRGYTSNSYDDAHEALRDKVKLESIDRQAVREAERQQRQSAADKAQLDEKKTAVQREREARKKEREDQLKQLIAADEDARDLLQAAEKVRAKWEQEKGTTRP
jgi:hypothetical protein